jgi:hypothetical protein
MSFSMNLSRVLIKEIIVIKSQRYVKHLLINYILLFKYNLIHKIISHLLNNQGT